MKKVVLLLLLTASPVPAQEARRHSSGRPLPPMPAISRPVMFDTPEADRILEALQVFPADNPWNQDVFAAPVDPWQLVMRV